MNKQVLNGIWLLKNRDENPNYDDFTININDAPLRFFAVEDEILYFKNDGLSVYQIGLRRRTEQERKEYDFDTLYDDSYFIAGNYDSDENKITISEAGIYKLLPNGQLLIRQHSDDYFCEEIWERIDDSHNDIGKFIETEKSNY